MDKISTPIDYQTEACNKADYTQSIRAPTQYQAKAHPAYTHSKERDPAGVLQTSFMCVIKRNLTSN